jgi:integrase
MRRDYGSGSLRELPDGRWQGRVDLGRDAGGRRLRPTFTGTKREVQSAIARAIRDREAGVAGASGRLTVRDYLARWMADSAAQRVRPRTLDGYRTVVEVHLVRGLGDVRLAKLTAPQVQAFVNAKAATLSPGTVRNIHAVLRRALNQAVRWGLIARNVATLVDLPPARHHAVQALTDARARAILEAVRGDRIEPLVTVTLATGLRQGEALGLRWTDVDLEAGTATIRHSLLRRGRVVELVEPKTARSRRTVVLPGFAVAALRRQRDWFQAQQRLLAGEDWREGEFVFTSSVGTPLDGTNVTHRLQQLLAAAGLPRMRFHDLRHGAATLLLAAGVHPRVVMETLGHSQISLTMNTYSHVVPALQRDAADRLEAMLG